MTEVKFVTTKQPEPVKRAKFIPNHKPTPEDIAEIQQRYYHMLQTPLAIAFDLHVEFKDVLKVLKSSSGIKKKNAYHIRGERMSEETRREIIKL